jgi:predicted nucleic acid-binding protein
MSDDPAFQALDDGEKSALTLGMTLGAELILIDDRKGAAVALQKGFQITGTRVGRHTHGPLKPALKILPFA